MQHGRELKLERCPHCGIAHPRIANLAHHETKSVTGKNARLWGVYACATCGGAVMAVAPAQGGEISELWPAPQTVADEIPPRAKEYLSQALSSVHAPVGSIVAAASSVDAMLKHKGYREGNLYSRIDKAAADHLITSEMAAWAHEIRLEANDQRHADEAAALPSPDDAARVIEFARALGQFLFVLPGRVERGRQKKQ